jgi:hypothetical protein
VPNADTNPWKVGALALAVALTGAFAVTRAHMFLAGPSTGRLWFALVALVVFEIVAVLMVIMVKHSGVLVATAFLAALLPIAVFAGRFTGAEFPTVLVIGFLAYGVLVVRAFLRGSEAIANSVTVKFFSVARMVVARLTTSFLLFTALLAYLTYLVWGGFTPELKERTVAWTASSATPILKVWFPNASFDQTGNEFFEAIAREKLESVYSETIPAQARGEITSGFRSFPPSVQEKLIAETKRELVKSAEKFLGTFDVEAPLREIFADAMARYLGTLPENIVMLLGILVVASAFAAVKGVASVTYWIVEGIAFLIFKLLLITGFASKSVEMRPHEFVNMP